MDIKPHPPSDSARRAEALFLAGDFEQAGEIYRDLLSAGFDGYGQRVNFAQCLKRQGKWHEATRQFDIAFKLRRLEITKVPDRKISAFYVQHLADQAQYLFVRGLIPEMKLQEFEAIQRLARFLKDFYGIHGEGAVTPEMIDPISHLVFGCLNYAQETGASARINPDTRIERIDLGVEGSHVYVVDDFLLPDTLAAMRRFLLESTIWYDARPQRGYLGAHLHDGLACDLVERTAQAVLEFAAGLIGPGLISQVWAFRYAPKAAGIDLHADQASWNVNMWLTDEAHNRNPQTGGMTIYGCRAPDDWQFEMYNASPDRVRAYLESSNAASRRIEYKANRAIVFDSRLFHKTDPVEFSPEFDGRRINMTFMIDKRS